MSATFHGFRFLLFFTLASFYWGLTLGIDLLNPALPLEQLKRIEGELVSFYRPLKHKSQPRIIFRTDDGSRVVFRGGMDGDEEESLKHSKGKRIVVWYQDYYMLFPPFYFKKFREVRAVTGELHVSYDNYHYIKNEFYPSTVLWFKRMIVLIVACLAIVILACFREAAKIRKFK